tara:strand:- start:204 stop:521 length:318 start_codon:yes stop_codon:yes gene_type:complete
MDKKTKQRQVFLTLINKQLEPFDKTYDDVLDDATWYTKYVVTETQESDFIKWGIDLIGRKLGLNKKQAGQEMQWFILQWGLKSSKIVNADYSIESLIKDNKLNKT